MILDRFRVEKLVTAARDKGECPDLSGLNLRGSSLWGINLRDVNLRNANLRDADLRGADLHHADLRGADLWGANLHDTTWSGLQITNLSSGQLILTPTCDGWKLRVGCWKATPDQLRELIAQDEGWPEAEGEEIARRRPYLQAALALCEVHMKDHANVIDDLKERWGNV